MRNMNKVLTVLEHNRLKTKGNPIGSSGRESNLNKAINNDYVNKSMDTKNLLRTPKENLAAYAVAIADRDRPTEETNDKLSRDKYLVKNRGVFESIQKKMVRNRRSSQHILSLFPDVKMAIQIIVTSMVSPNKLTDTELNYRLNQDFLVGEETLRGLITNLIMEHVEKEYRLAGNLSDILTDVIGKDGCAPHLIINEAVVSDEVNADLVSNLALESYKSSMDLVLENMTKRTNVLNPKPKEYRLPKTPTTDFVKRLACAENLNITDNMNILGFKKLKTTIRDNIMRNSRRKNSVIAAESSAKLDYLDLFRERERLTDKPLVSIGDRKKATRKGIGKPMMVRLPPESVIPIFAPGNKDDHLGYIVLLDEMGSPVVTPISESGFNRINSNIHDTSGMTPTTSLSGVYRDLIGSEGDECSDIREIYDVYKNVIEGQLLESFKGSMYGEHVELVNNDYIYYIMFCRAMADQKTTLLYVPAENLTYFSLFNNDYGVGESLLENIKVVCGIRAVLLFAETMAFTKAAINVTEVDITLDEMDPDPEKRLDEAKSLILSAGGDFLPLGLEDPQALTDWIQRAGYKINVTNMPGFPNMQFDYRTSASDGAMPEGTLKEELTKRSAQGLGMTPELIDSAFSDDFAVGKIISNANLVKRIKDYQKLASQETTKFVSSIIYNDEMLRDKIRKLVKEHEQLIYNNLDEGDSSRAFYDRDVDGFIDYYIDQISANISVELPQISDNSTNITAQEYDTYMEWVDKVLDTQMDSTIFSEEFVGETGRSLDTIKSAIRAVVAKRWCVDNNFLPEVFEMLGNDEDTNEDTLDSIKEHTGAVLLLAQNVYSTVTDLRLQADKANKALVAKIEKASEESDGGSMFDTMDSGDSDDDDGDKKGDGDSKGGGDDDLGLDDLDLDF